MSSVLANGPGLSAGEAGQVVKFNILAPTGGKFNPTACSVAFEGSNEKVNLCVQHNESNLNIF